MKPATRRILKEARRRRAPQKPRYDWRASPWPWRIAGVLLVAAVLALSWRIEWTAMRYQSALRGIAGSGAQVVDLGGDGALPSPRLQGDLVRVYGMPQVIEAPRDAQFSQSADALQLRREVAMFQWQQVNVGYPVYELEWQPGRVDSQAFARPSGHTNPQLPVDPADFPAPRVRLDGFLLDPALVERVPGNAAHPVDAAALPANLAATFGAYEGDLYTGNPKRPHLGDVRLRWSVVMPQAITVLARVDDGRLVAGPGAEVQLGDRSLGDLLPQLPPRPLHVWVERIAVWLLALLAVAVLLRGRGPRPDPALVALGGTVLVLCCPALMWMDYSLWLGGALLLAAVLLAALAVWRGRPAIGREGTAHQRARRA